jgi:hypothetical protein
MLDQVFYLVFLVEVDRKIDKVFFLIIYLNNRQKKTFILFVIHNVFER